LKQGFNRVFLEMTDLQKKTMPELDRVSKEAFDSLAKIPVVLLLDDVRSMNNVGSVFRSADVFLIEAIYLCGITPQPPHRDINKTALGATETVKWKYYESIEQAIKSLKDLDFEFIAIEQVHGSVPLENSVIDKNKKYALIFGNEVNGVSNKALELCNSAFEITQGGSKHSLNISVTAGIVAWHFYSAFNSNK
jgi:23S rRNA (guanosine2251-2'-O)-methyltransferase